MPKGRLSVDESQIVKKSEQVTPSGEQVTPPPVNPTPNPPTDYKFFEAQAQRQLQTPPSHPEPTNSNAPKVVYEVSRDREKRVTVVRGALTKPKRPEELSRALLDELLVNTERELLKTQVEVTVHERMTDHPIAQQRLKTLQDNLNYLRLRKQVILELLGELGE